MEILGIFTGVENAAKAVEALLRSGFTEAQIDSLTSVPYPDGVLVNSEQAQLVPLDRPGRRSGRRSLRLRPGGRHLLGLPGTDR